MLTNYNAIPPYVTNQAGFYNQIAEEFHTQTAQAKTEDEYKEALSKVCERWRKELLDRNVQMYFNYTGEFDREEVEAMTEYYQATALPFQKAIMGCGLQQNEKYTLVYVDDFGFPVAHKIMLKGFCICEYAQYKDAAKIIYRGKGQRMDREMTLYNKSIAIYKGWKDIPESVTYETVRDNGFTVIRKSRYTGFDARYFTDCVQYLGNPLLLWENFKVRESDGRVFA